MPGHFYGNPGLPKRQDPLLGLSDVIQRKAEQIRLASDRLQELPERSLSYNQTAFGAPLRFFLSGLTPLAFPIHLVTTRQWCYLTHSWGSVFSFGVDSLSLSYPLGDHKAVVLFDP